MYYVYLLRSIAQSKQTYVGFTEDLKTRFRDHNQGKSYHTAKFKPWRLVAYLGFDERARAVAFEKYLKSHSGKAFANKRLF